MNVWTASAEMVSIVRDIILVCRMFVRACITEISVWNASVEMVSIVRDIMLLSRVFVRACTTQKYQCECVEGFSGDGVCCQRYYAGK